MGLFIQKLAATDDWYHFVVLELDLHYPNFFSNWWKNSKNILKESIKFR